MEIRFLGTGAAEGVPVVGCECTHCMVAQEEERSTRLRTAIQVTQDERSILLDAGVDIRRQLLASDIQCIDAILISHEHYDHAYGLKELKYWPSDGGYNGTTELCAPQSLLNGITFLYEDAHENETLLPRAVRPYIFADVGPFQVKPVRIAHTSISFGYLVQGENAKLAYLSDISAVPDVLMKQYKRYIAGSDVLIIDTPFFESQPGKHMGVYDAIRLGEALGCRQTVLTHINHHNYPYSELQKRVGERALIAYDGMVIGI